MPVSDHIDNVTRLAEFNPSVATTTFVLTYPVYQAASDAELKSDFLVVKDNVVQTGFTVTGTFLNGVSINAAIVFSPGITGNLKVYSRRRPRSALDLASGRGATPEELNAIFNSIVASQRDIYDWLTRLEALNVLPAGTFVPTAGGSMSGFLTLVGNPTDVLHAAPKQYVDAINVLTTKGDLVTRGASANARLPVGVNGKMLTADSAQSSGIKWGHLAGTSLVLTSGANIPWDMDLATDAEVVLAHSGNFDDPTNVTVGRRGFLYVTQDATGNRIPTWGAIFKWPNNIVQRPDTTAGAVTCYRYRVRSVSAIELTKEWMGGRDAIGFFKEYDKGTYTTGANITQAHGLGRYPSLIQVFLECTAINLGYAVGERVEVGTLCDGASSNQKPTLYMNTTNVVLRTGSGAPQVIDGVGSSTPITAASWKVILRVYE